MSQLPRADKEQCAAFIVRNPLLFEFPGMAVDRHSFYHATLYSAMNDVWYAGPIIWITLSRREFSLQGCCTAPLRFSSPMVSTLYRCQEIDRQLIGLVWKNRPSGLGTSAASFMTSAAGTTASAPASEAHMVVKEKTDDTRRESKLPESDEKRANVHKSWFGWRTEKMGRDIEADKPATRPTRLFAPVYNGLGAGLCLCESPVYS